MVLYAILLFNSIGYYCNEISELTILNIYCMLCCYFYSNLLEYSP